LVEAVCEGFILGTGLLYVELRRAEVIGGWACADQGPTLCQIRRDEEGTTMTVRISAGLLGLLYAAGLLGSCGADRRIGDSGSGAPPPAPPPTA
jgi:hypothetical protein